MRRGLTIQEIAPKPPEDFRQPADWLHSGQLRVWESNAIDIVACAGTQGGKTKTEAPWLLREIQRCAPLIKSLRSGKFIYAGPTLELLKAQAIPSFKELFQEDLKLGRLIEGQKPVFRFSKEGLMRTLGFSDCPVTVHFAYTKDSSNLESMTALAGIWDEAGQKENKYESYGAYNRRLKVARSTTFEQMRKNAPQWWIERFFDIEGPKAAFGRRMWGTTPYDWGWFKNEVIDRAEKNEQGFAFFNWASWLNPRVSEAECLSELEKGMPLWRWQMMYRGMFTRPAGAIYDTFDFQIDTCEDFAIPAAWKVYPGFDFGSSNMAGVVVAENPVNNELFVIDIYHAGGRTYQEHADAFRKSWSFSPGAGGNHNENGERDAYRGRGVPLDEPPNVGVDVQIASVYAQVKTHNLKVFRSCKGLIEQMQIYSRVVDVNGVVTDEILDKSKFHYCDALRYVVSKLRPLAVKEEPAILSWMRNRAN